MQPAMRPNEVACSHRELSEVGKCSANRHIEWRFRRVLLGSHRGNRDICKRQLGGGLAQKRCLLAIAVEQGDSPLRPGDRERNPGQATATAHIDQPQ